MMAIVIVRGDGEIDTICYEILISRDWPWKSSPLVEYTIRGIDKHKLW